MPDVWRQFKFFSPKTLTAATPQHAITCCAVSPHHVVLGDSHGALHVLHRETAETLGLISAYTAVVYYMLYVPSRDILATLGEDDSHSVCIVRLWSISDIQRYTAAGVTSATASMRKPPYREYSVQSHVRHQPAARTPIHCLLGAGDSQGEVGGAALPVNCKTLSSLACTFDVSGGLFDALIGFTSDELVLLRGDLMNNRNVMSRRVRSRMTKGSLRWACFCTLKGTQETGRSGPVSLPPAPVLFTLYEDTASLWHLSGQGEWIEHACCTNSPFGTSMECGSRLQDGRIVVASSKTSKVAIFGTISEQRNESTQEDTTVVTSPNSACYTAFQVIDIGGEAVTRRQLYSHRRYIVVLDHEGNGPSDRATVQCYEPCTGVRALSQSQGQQPSAAQVTGDAEELLVVSAVAEGDRRLRLLRLQETSLGGEVGQLERKGCYEIAKQMIATAQQSDPELYTNVVKRYGDDLYAKGKYAEAMTQYSETVGHLEPSYVIRRYAQGHLADLLIGYLEELHHERHGVRPSTCHTALLLNCYIRRKESAKLLQFVKRSTTRLDAFQAIDTCRQAGYYDVALALADKYSLPLEYARVLVTDTCQPQKALAYLHTVGVEEVETIMKVLGRSLLRMQPRTTTELLCTLCVCWKGPRRRLGVVDTSSTQPQRPTDRSVASAWLYLLADYPVCMLNFLRSVLASGVLDAQEDVAASAIADRPLYHTLLELYLVKDLQHHLGLADGAHEEVETGDTYVVESLSSRQEQALSFLDAYQGRYEVAYALRLAYEHVFLQGVRWLLENDGQPSDVVLLSRIALGGCEAAVVHDEIMQYIAKAKQSPPMPSRSNSSMWRLILSNLVRGAGTPSGERDLTDVLEHIHRHNLLLPLTVVEVLSSAELDLPFHIVRDFCMKSLGALSSEAIHGRDDVARTLDDIKEHQQFLRTLRCAATVLHGCACAFCGKPLTYPTVYYRCQHAFHEECLQTKTCPVCGIDGSVHATEDIGEQQASEKPDSPAAFDSRAMLGDAVALAYFHEKDVSSPSTAAVGVSIGEELLTPEEVEIW